MVRISLRTLTLATAGLLLASCGDENGVDPAAATGDPQPAAVDDGNPDPQDKLLASYGFEVWHDDFPIPIELLEPEPGRWYDKSRRGTLETVAQNLSGTCTREAWLMAKQFFPRVEPDEAEILITTLDRALQSNMNDIAETALGAMGRVGNPMFAPAILRAMERREKGIQNAAAKALSTCADAETFAATRKKALSWHGSSQVYWFQAAQRVLPPADAARLLADGFAEPQMRALRGELVKVAVKLPPEHAAVALQEFKDRPPTGLEGTLLGIRHAAGDDAATVDLRDMLHSDAPSRRRIALGALRVGGAEVFRDRVLQLSTDPVAEVRLAALEAMFGWEGEEVSATLEMLALDENLSVRQNALRRLVELGRLGMLDDLIAGLRTATGSAFNVKIADAVAARDPRAIPVIVERMQAAPLTERRRYLRAIGHMQVAEGFPALRDLFVGPQVNYSKQGNPSLESDAYTALLMANLRGAEDDVLALFESIDRDDYRRRALLLQALTTIAADREDSAFDERFFTVVRRIVLDMEEIPQMRLLALQYLVRAVDLDDVMKLSRQTRKEETRAMRLALTAFLVTYF